jgi:hypothetical protein
MKVRAIGDAGQHLPSHVLERGWGLTKESSFPIRLGREYGVFAITAVKDIFWYYILDEHDLPYPVWYPSPLFEVVDGSIPAHWVVSYMPHRSSDDRVGTSLISFAEWATDPAFYERLVDGQADAVAIFQRERGRQ